MTSQPSSFHVPPPVFAFGAAAAQHWLAGRSARSSTPGSRCLGGVIALGSGALAGAAIDQFRRRQTTVDPVKVDHANALVTSGPNSVTRNPMYVGLAGALVGHAVARRSWTALLPAAAFVAVIDRLQIRDEEVAMRALFEDEYDEYVARVPRWVGPVVR